MKKVIIVICILLLSPGMCVAAEKIVLVTDEWPPYVSKSMEDNGSFVALVSAVFKEAGLDIEYEFYPWLRCEDKIKQGIAFAAFPYRITDARQASFNFSAPIANAITKLFFFTGKLKSNIEWEKLADLKPYKIGGTYGYWYDKTFKDAGITLDQADNDEQNIKKLYAGRIDLLATNELVGWFFIKQLFPTEINNFDTVKKPIDVSGLHLMVSRAYPNAAAITTKFNTALQNIKDKGIYAAIMKKYNMAE